MSKLVKDLLTNHLRSELEGVQELLLVSVVGLTANNTAALRRSLRDKNIKLLVIKNSLARRATEGTQLAPAFEGSDGTLAMIWGSTDIVSLAKEVVKLAGEKQYEAFRARGGVMGGTRLAAEEVDQISKWPTREEQIGIIVGQMLSVGAKLAGQLNSAGGGLVGQIKQIAEKEGEAAPETEAAAPESVTAEAGSAETAAPAGDAPAEG